MSDHYAFVLEAARALRAGALAEIDLAAVAEELEHVGRSDAHELRSRLAQILEQRLKLDYTGGTVLEYNRRLWRASILRQQDELAILLEESPSLRGLMTGDLLRRRYEAARAAVSAEYGIDPPPVCPYTYDQLLTNA